MNQLLKWSLENSETTLADGTATTDPKAERPSGRGVNAEALNALLGGPSDADLMKESMAAILNPEVSLENKLIAFDNFEQLIEGIDNANNMESLGLWTPLVSLLQNPEPDLRRYAAWCAGTAVQNNPKSQERFLVLGGIPTLVKLAREDPVEAVRRKASYALSSETRNYQPGLDEALRSLPKDFAPEEKVDATDMEAVDRITNRLRKESVHMAQGGKKE